MVLELQIMEEEQMGKYTFDPISVSSGDDILVVRSVSAMSSYFDSCYSNF